MFKFTVTTSRHPWVLAYDVTDDKRRTGLAHFLEAHGHRVQFSVFEVLATPEELDDILKRALIARRFDPESDSLRCYPLCAHCSSLTKIRGRAPELLSPERPVVL